MLLSGASCCSLLASTHPHLKISLPGSLAYNSTEASYWSLQESQLTPACIALPTSTADVSALISTLTSPRCHDSCPFAIKSQGHAPAAGFANIGPVGVTLDLSGLDSITYDPHRGVASVGAGASWLQVYAALDPFNRTVAGGRNGRVGVGGLTLGGGISYFSPRVGFTCDTVVNFEVVLADGRTVGANASANSDLFRALKGGTNNLGVVTRFEFATLEVGEILGGSIGNAIEDRGAVFRAFADIAGAREYDVYASVVTGLIFSSSSRSWSLSSTPIYTKPVREPPVYQDLFAVPQISNSLNLTRLHVFSNESATPPLNWMFQTGTYGVSATLLEQIFEISNRTVYNFTVPGGVIWDFALEPLPTVFTSRGARKNVLGTSPADGNGMIMLLTALWPNSSSSAQVEAKAKQLLTEINGAASKSHLLHDFVYTNYAGASQKPLVSYGSSNKDFLQRTARKYDRTGVFQKQVPGGFKLSS